jgi:hypothetical protein
MIGSLRLLAAFALLGAAPALAETWMFRPSYYTHNPTTHVRIGRQYSEGPIYSRPQGGYVRSGYRNMRSTIQVGGNTYDHTNVWESWVQFGEQY